MRRSLQGVERNSGAAGDLKYATTLAATMVGSFGMGDTLLSWDAVHAGTDLVGKVLSSDVDQVV